jgi:hypothetical protein
LGPVTHYDPMHLTCVALGQGHGLARRSGGQDGITEPIENSADELEHSTFVLNHQHCLAAAREQSFLDFFRRGSAPAGMPGNSPALTLNRSFRASGRCQTRRPH